MQGSSEQLFYIEQTLTSKFNGREVVENYYEIQVQKCFHIVTSQLNLCTNNNDHGSVIK